MVSMDSLLITANTVMSPLAGSGDNAWTLNKFLTNAKGGVQTVGGSLIALLGVIMIIWGGVQIAKALLSHGKGQSPNWVVCIALIVVGGAFATGGLTLLSNIGRGGYSTVNDIGTGKDSDKLGHDNFEDGTYKEETILIDGSDFLVYLPD